MILLNKYLKLIWDRLDGNKLLIGLSLSFLVDHLLPPNTWYADLCNVLAYAFIAAGGGHKVIKSKYGTK